MHRRATTISAAIIFTMCAYAADQVKLIVLDPGHFHASLVQKDMYPQVDPTVSVYAPFGPEVIDYLNRVAVFNTRKENPTAWKIELHAGPDFFGRMLQEHHGNGVIITVTFPPQFARTAASARLC